MFFAFPLTFPGSLLTLFGRFSDHHCSSYFSRRGFFLAWNMLVEVIETPNGWPLGLGNISMRLIATQNSEASPPTPGEQSPTEMPSPSFSSFSSSNLDTESTASFFPDKTVSLGLLMGIKPGNRGALPFTNTMDIRQQRSLPGRRSNAEVSRTNGVETSQGLCVPLLQNVIEKMSRSKSTTRVRTLI